MLYVHYISVKQIKIKYEFKAVIQEVREEVVKQQKEIKHEPAEFKRKKMEKKNKAILNSIQNKGNQTVENTARNVEMKIEKN